MTARKRLLILFFFMPLAQAETLSLPELERKLLDQPNMAQAARYAADASSLGEPTAAWGWRFFGAAGMSQEKEPQAGIASREYRAADAELGVLYPLLGTREREKATLRATEVQVINSRIDALIKAEQKMQLLRESYVTLWASQRKQELTKGYLSEADRFTKVMDARRKSGLLRESGRQESLLSFSEARRNASAFTTNGETAENILRQLLPGLPAAWNTERPALLSLEGIKPPQLGRQQEREALSAINAQRSELSRSERFWPVDSDVALSYRLRDESDAGMPLGGGYGVRWRFSVPIGGTSTATAQRRQYDADMRRTQSEIEMRQAQQSIVWQRALDDYRRQRANLRYSRERLAAATRQEKEDSQRANLLTGVSGDVLERWQRSRYALYQSGIDAIEAQEAFLLAQARVLTTPSSDGKPDQRLEEEWAALDSGLGSFAMIAVVPATGARAVALSHPEPDSVSLAADSAAALHAAAILPMAGGGSGGIATAQANTAATSAPVAWRFYAWKAAPILAGQGQTVLAGVPPRAALWLSFSAEEINQLAAVQGKPAVALRQWLAAARKQGRQVHLLLGDAGWLKPGGGDSLLKVISPLMAYGFDGIHLDLEPDQLPEAKKSRAPLLDAMAARVQEVREATRLPVGVSLHWRDAAPDAVTCLLCKLEKAGVSEVTLMIYSSKPESVAARALPILKANPRLRFSIAQSVEPASVLSKEESYASSGRQKFQQQMQQLDAQLQTQRNYAGIAVQAWDDYQKMGN